MANETIDKLNEKKEDIKEKIDETKRFKRAADPEFDEFRKKKNETMQEINVSCFIDEIWKF